MLTNSVDTLPAGHATLRGHLAIARVDHWVKNVFVLPGVVAALGLDPSANTHGLISRLVLGLLAVGLVASSNYTINEVVDAPFDRHHPDKQHRPVPSGLVNIPLAYVQWILLGAIGVGLGFYLSRPLAVVLGALWVMGCVYNIRPVRSKDIPYLDVLSEAINNPLRMLAGWYLVSNTILPPATLLLSYWMVGCYFMAIKRYAECREINDSNRIAAYRKSLAYFSPERLITVIVFYASASMLFFGAFIIRYRLELIASFPFIALVMAVYLSLAFKDRSAAQNPEKLYREPVLMGAVIACTAVMAVLLFTDVPMLRTLFAPTVPVAAIRR